MSLQMVSFLLVEDDYIDIRAIKRLLEELRIANPLHVAKNGVEALEYLRGEKGRKRIRKPYMVLLDLNMPRMGGLEFLEHVRKDVELHTAVIFVLTTSADPGDVLKAYEKNVAGYVVKSNPRTSFLKALEMIDNYWRVVELPL